MIPTTNDFQEHGSMKSTGRKGSRKMERIKRR
jgi:hypothetical protein